MKSNVLYLLLSAAIAFGLWAYVITVVSPEWEETYYNIPVVLNNEDVLHDNGLMIMEEETPTVTLKLRGNRSDLVKLNRGNITLIANLATIYDKGEQQLVYSISYPGDVPSNSIEVLNKDPQVLTLTVVERKTAQIPVVPEFIGTLPDMHRMDTENMTLNHQHIVVSGPADVVDKIATAKIPVNLSGQKQTISQSYAYTFCDQEGKEIETKWLDTNVSEVNMTLRIQPYKSVGLDVNIIGGGGVKADDVKWIIAEEDKAITISGAKQYLDKVGDTLPIRLNLAEVSATDGGNTVEVECEIELPEGIENLTGKETVKITIVFPRDLEAKEFTITNIQPEGLAENLEASFQTLTMKVYIRGKQDAVNALEEEDLVLMVDLSEAKVGTDTYKVTLMQECDEYGLLFVGIPHTVTVTVTPKG